MRLNFAIIGSMILLMGTQSCKKNETQLSTKNVGYLQMGLTQNETVFRSTSKMKSTVSIMDYKVNIYKTDGSLYKSFNRYADVPQSLEMEIGSYYVGVTSDNKQNAAFENPYYYGQSAQFTIQKAQNSSISVECTLANAKVTVTYSNNVKTNFSDYKLFVARGTDTLLFGKDDIREGFFEPGALNLRTDLEYIKPDGTTGKKSLSGVIANAMARKHYEIQIDALPDNGTSSIIVTINDSVSKEVIVLSETPSSQTKTMDQLISGDLIVTELMANPDALTDDLGEWFEVYNNSDSDVNLNGLIVKYGTKEYIVSTDQTVTKNAYVVFAKTDQATSANNFIYGATFSFVNTSGSIQLENASGTVLSTMTYSTAPTGASIQLDIDSYSAPSDPLSWCTSTLVYSTGDKGTPGAQNTQCD